MVLKGSNGELDLEPMIESSYKSSLKSAVDVVTLESNKMNMFAYNLSLSLLLKCFPYHSSEK